MSHYGNKMNMGFVATPYEVVDRTARFLKGEGACHFLDPCCGMGEALYRCSKALGVGTTFGIELDIQRSQAAAKLLNTVISGSYEHCYVGQADLLWLNPPYDTDMGKQGKRLELTFLRETQDWLRPGGILVYIIRQKHITTNVARRLSSWFDNITVYAFPEHDYQSYQQVVILGVKRETQQKDDETNNRLLLAAQMPLPELPEVPDRQYIIPTRDELTPWRFRLKRVTPDEMQIFSKESGVWTTHFWNDLFRIDIANDRPLLPLRSGHLALFMAAGLIDNVELKRGEHHYLVKGTTHKVAVDVTTAEEKKAGITRTVDEFKVIIYNLNLNTGKANRLSDPSVLTKFVDEWQQELSQAIIDAYPPLHDLTITEVQQTILSALLKHKRLPNRTATGLLPSQKHAAIAAAKSVRKYGSATLVMATGTGKTATALGAAMILQVGGV